MESRSHSPVAIGDRGVLAIAGLGLIGGSIGLAARRAGWRVVYDDPAVTEDDAVRQGAADARLPMERFVDADLVVIATPLDVAMSILARLPPAGTTTSVCGLMQPLVRAAGTHSLKFTAGHPMAGAETSGLAAARADLFAGRAWFLAEGPIPGTLRTLITDCGASVVQIDPQRHDGQMTLTSHLPQLLSSALASLIVRNTPDEAARGTGLETFLRLSGSDWEVWRPLFTANAEEIRARLRDLDQILERIVSGDGAADFASAQQLRKNTDGPTTQTP